MCKIKIVIDKDIPYVHQYLDEAFDAQYCAGNKITKDVLKNAEAMVIRTVTKCNRELLEGSEIRLIITATIGDDHIDKEYCLKNNIAIRTAEACNSDAVVQYVLMSLFYLNKQFGYQWQDKTVGIIGVGNIGSRLNNILQGMGIKTLLHDPPREKREGKKDFVSLQEIREKSDIISLHTPYITSGKYKTRYLLDDLFFSSSQKKIVLINSSRGPILSTITLLKWKKEGIIKHLILDVWEDEPTVDPQLLKLTDISTPHIAGYSLRGKITATYMSLQHLHQFFQVEKVDLKDIFSNLSELQFQYDYKDSISEERNIWEALKQVWNIEEDSYQLSIKPLDFLKIRANYSFRNEFRDIKLKSNTSKSKFNTTLRHLQHLITAR